MNKKNFKVAIIGLGYVDYLCIVCVKKKCRCSWFDLSKTINNLKRIDLIFPMFQMTN